MTPAGRRLLFKFLALTVPALVVCGVFLAAVIETWVRATWDPRRGSPGLFVSDPVRGQRLAADYDGWFAGVPVRINNLGFRDDRDYELAKRPNTFRILVLGDSVTFGHGSVHTYPRLLEDRLRAWRSDVDWQVWNAAVPGYNTSQELAQLLDVGPRFNPDLVVVGFFDNDLADNTEVRPAGKAAEATSDVLSWVQRHVYSFEFYKRLGLQIAWRFSGQDAFRRRLEHLGTESQLLENMAQVQDLEEQAIGSYERLTDEQVRAWKCPYGEKAEPTLIDDIKKQPGWEHWLDAVRRFQQFNRDGPYRVMFFLNVVPPICPEGDAFYEGGARVFNDFLMGIVGDGAPAVSTLDAFLHRRPSQMPAARAHAIGNSNMTKAEVLFDYLRDSVLPPLLPADR
jgi:GDSL-like lipase/acylhydrolase family protein